MNLIRVILHGCNGKMGLKVSEIIDEDSRMEIVAGVDQENDTDHLYPVFDSLDECDVEADVVIDFSNASATDRLIKYCVDKELPLVLCTTGLSDAQAKEVEEASRKVAILRSANMSLGVNLLLKLLKDATKVLSPAGFDVEIVERHHNQKVDAPSGTAIALADSVNEAAGNKYTYTYDRSSKRESRDENEIGISSVRGGSIPGDHEVIFAGPDEVIELKHTVYSRSVFAKGAVEAAAFLAGKPIGYYDMSDVIDA